MSELLDASEIRELAAGIERQQVMDIVRGATFVGTLLLGWISLHPFESLGDMQIGDAGTGNELATYAVFGALSVLTVALAMRNDAQGLATLLSPAFVLFGAWLLATVVLSFDPGTSIKRLSLTICVVAVTAALMLLPKSQQELMHWFTMLCPPYTASNLPHHARFARIAFQRIAIPLRCVRRGLVAALQEIEQRLVGIGGRTHGIVGQDEFAERFAEERRVGPHLGRAEA
jgi:hypothetical protein